jgi:hypothetical protein
VPSNVCGAVYGGAASSVQRRTGAAVERGMEVKGAGEVGAVGAGGGDAGRAGAGGEGGRGAAGARDRGGGLAVSMGKGERE